ARLAETAPREWTTNWNISGCYSPPRARWFRSYRRPGSRRKVPSCASRMHAVADQPVSLSAEIAHAQLDLGRDCNPPPRPHVRRGGRSVSQPASRLGGLNHVAGADPTPKVRRSACALDHLASGSFDFSALTSWSAPGAAAENWPGFCDLM